MSLFISINFHYINSFIFPNLIKFNSRSIINFSFQMSTLAAARADNFYIPKNYNPEKVPPKKSQLAEEKPFKVVEGQRVGGGKVRYQTPFHVRCEGCENMVAKGVRFNAIKTWVGNFHSTKIYEFRMKCPQCVQKFVVRTDPQNCDYIYVSGAKRIFQTKDCTDESRIRDESIQQKIKQDPFFKLENQVKDKEAYCSMNQTIEKLHEVNQRGQQDFELNRLLRKKMRQIKQDEHEYFKMKKQKNLFIPLESLNQQDEKEAQKVKYKNQKTKSIKKQTYSMSQRQKLKQKMKKINPNFQKLLKSEIKNNNKPICSNFYKK